MDSPPEPADAVPSDIDLNTFRSRLVALMTYWRENPRSSAQCAEELAATLRPDD